MGCMLVCAAVVSALEGKDCREVMKSIAEISPVPADRLQHIVAGMRRLLSEAIRIPAASLKQEVSTPVMTQKSISLNVIYEILKCHIPRFRHLKKTFEN